jgi:cold shock CspA family protein
MRTRGTVKWFSSDDGIGFIRRPDGPDVLVERRALADAAVPLHTGDRVEFEVLEEHRRLTARDVRRLGSQVPARGGPGRRRRDEPRS